MKIKSILVASVAMAFAVSAQATTLVITGATAFRAAANTTIKAAYPTAKVAFTTDGGVTSIDKATLAVFDDSANTGVVILTSFNGSVEGVKALDNDESLTVLDTTKFTNTGTVGTPMSFASSGKTTTAKANLAFSDVFQGSTPHNVTTLGDDVVGVVPFVWVTNSVGLNKITNMTSQLARQTLGYQSLLSMFTNNAADSGVNVYAIGRDSGSGTRMNTLAEIKYPAATVVQQYQPTIVSGTVTGLAIWPASTGVAIGDGGYTSGGKIADALKVPISVANTALVGYVGTTDANTVKAAIGNAAQLTYNGVAYSENAVYNGAYTFWGYEHLLTSANGLSTEQQAIKDTIVSSIPGNLSTAGLPADSMLVGRIADGDTVGF